eukprot:Hpha_TRINITY_DN16192_c0_g4::TRINITY_DN16192_c0_g4_i1::g.7701::m.7701
MAMRNTQSSGSAQVAQALSDAGVRHVFASSTVETRQLIRYAEQAGLEVHAIADAATGIAAEACAKASANTTAVVSTQTPAREVPGVCWVAVGGQGVLPGESVYAAVFHAATKPAVVAVTQAALSASSPAPQPKVRRTSVRPRRGALPVFIAPGAAPMELPFTVEWGFSPRPWAAAYGASVACKGVRPLAVVDARDAGFALAEVCGAPISIVALHQGDLDNATRLLARGFGVGFSSRLSEALPSQRRQVVSHQVPHGTPLPPRVAAAPLLQSVSSPASAAAVQLLARADAADLRRAVPSAVSCAVLLGALPEGSCCPGGGVAEAMLRNAGVTTDVCRSDATPSAAVHAAAGSGGVLVISDGETIDAFSALIALPPQQPLRVIVIPSDIRSLSPALDMLQCRQPAPHALLPPLDLASALEAFGFTRAHSLTALSGRQVLCLSEEVEATASTPTPAQPSTPTNDAPIVQDPRAPKVRTGDTSFAEAELRRVVGSGGCDVWEILTIAERMHGDRSAVPEKQHSYGDLAARVRGLAAWLQVKAGVQSGDRVAVMAPNLPEVMEAHYSVAGVRGVVLNLNQRLAPSELEYVLHDSAPKVLIVHSQYAPLLTSTPLPDSATHVVWIGGEGAAKEATEAEYYERAVSCEEQFSRPAHCSEDDAMEMYYTSGTTGRPKGVQLSHKVVVLHALGCMIEHRHHKHDVWGHFAPMFHLVDAYSMYSITWVGGSHVFVPTFSAENVLGTVQRCKVTVTNMASTMATLLLSHPAASSFDLSSLQLVSCGGAPLNRETVLRAMRLFGCEFFQSYGMTECCGKISMSLLHLPHFARTLPVEEQVDLVCSSGRSFQLPGFEMRVVEDDGTQVLPLSDKVGEVQIRGPTVFKGYYNNPGATAEAFTKDGWFCTGDLARCLAGGYIEVCDRKKDMVLTGSENVYSVEVERCVMENPKVKLCSVIGVPNALLGEAVKAFVVLEEGQTATEAEIRRHCARALADYKVPRHVEFLPLADMPLTGTGKVAKAELKKRERLMREAPPLPDIYQVNWRPAPLPANPPGTRSASGAWAVYGSAAEGSAASTLAQRLRQAGAQVRVAAPASPCPPVAANESVVYMWGLETACTGASEPKATEDSQRMVMEFLQSLVACGGRNRLWVVTRGAAVNIDGTTEGMQVDPSQQALWGVARVMSVERPQARCRVVDLCPGDLDAAANADAIFSELVSGADGTTADAESAWRRRRRYAPQLEAFPLSSPPPPTPTLRKDATYLLTGGTGGLGRKLAATMAAEWNAGTIVLVSRRPPSEEVSAELDALEKRTGARVVVAQGDVSSRSDVARLLVEGVKGLPPVRGIFHLAGVVDDGGVEAQTWERYQKVLAPKVAGSWNLHEASQGLELDYFVMFSSIYGLLGYRELTHYAAANAYQDGLAQFRRSRSLPATAVSWGTWADAGMAHGFGAGFRSFWESQGMGFVPLDGGMRALGVLCTVKATHAGVFPVSWDRYQKARVRQGNHALAAGFCAPPQRTGKQKEERASGFDARKAVRVIAEELLEDEVDMEAAVAEIGLTSMLIVDLTQRLSEGTSLDLSPTLVYECVTLQALADHIAKELGPANAPSAAVAVPSSAAPFVRLLAPLPASQRLTALTAAVIPIAAELLGASEGELDPAAPVVELGFSSMTVVDFTSRLAEETGCDDLSPTLLYEAVTLRGLAERLMETLGLTAKDGPVADEAQGSKDEGDDSLAIVGMSCRLPGGAMDVPTYWANLRKGVDAVIPAPADRPSNGFPSGYLAADTLQRFDREAFGIGGAEAEVMDPQQRLLLQVVAECFEDAGIVLDSIEDRRIGVFVGVSTVEYGGLQQQHATETPSPYCGTSWHLSIAANRISYTFDLNGPSVSLDTACSSSLVALHLAARAIRAGDCSMAVVCGANIQLLEVWSEAFVRAGMLSPTWRCRFGDDGADGYVRGEGVGAVLLRPATVARASGSLVYAELASTAVNQDARSNGLTAPNPASQEALLRTAYTAARAQHTEVSYIEAHGTGTHLGDPIELTALGRVLGHERGPRGAPLLIGSAKSAIGHLECAAGIAGLIKAAKICETGRVPPSLHFRRPNQHIAFERLGIEVVAPAERPLPVPPGGERALVGVSGFGFGGTNAHAVLRRPDSDDTAPAVPAALPPSGFHFVPLSAHSAAALRATAGRWAEVVEDMRLGDICAAAWRDRSHSARARKHRACVAAASEAALAQGLRAIASDAPEDAPGTAVGSVVSNSPPRIAFVFTGQGSQYPGMGRGLFSSSLVFQETMREAEVALGEVGFSGLTETLYGTQEQAERRFQRAGFVQPALVAVEVGLARVMIREHGVQPHVMMGHSLGEISACAVAGMITLRQAIQLAAARGSAMETIPAGRGAMAATRADEEVLKRVIADVAPDAAVAAVNGPQSCVVSGPRESVDTVLAVLAEKGIKAKRLDVTHGFHSSEVDACLPTLREAAQRILGSVRGAAVGGLCVVSNVDGAVMEQGPDAEHWVRHARGAVLFNQSVMTAVTTLGVSVMVEIGPQPHLSVQLEGILASHSRPTAVVPTLRRNAADLSRVQRAVAAVWCAGGALPPPSLDDSVIRRVRLPTTAFVGDRHWVDTRPSIRQLEAGEASRAPSTVLYATEWRTCPAPPGEGSLTGGVLAVGGGAALNAVCALLEEKGCSVHRLGAMPLAREVEEALLRRRDSWGVLVGGAVEALLAAVQGAVKAKASRLAVLTHGAWAEGSGRAEAVGDAALWGFLRSAKHELPPKLLTAAVEFPPGGASAAVGELSSKGFGSDDVRLAPPAARQVPRIVAVPAVPPSRSAGYRAPRGTFLVTGGTGALGLQLAAWLIGRGATHVVLLSRSGSVAQANTRLFDVARRQAAVCSATVEVHACDVAKDGAARELVRRHADGLKAGGGVVHCAGVLDDGLLLGQTSERLTRVTTPKVEGAERLLDALDAEGLSPSLVLFFSSVTALMGNAGQVSYGAANASLDRLAHFRREHGHPNTHSVQWGPWGGYGMAAGLEAAKADGESLWVPLTPEQGWSSLDSILAPGTGAVTCVSRFNWDSVRELAATADHQANLWSEVLPPPPRPVAQPAVLTGAVAVAAPVAAAVPLSRGEVVRRLAGLLVKFQRGGATGGLVESSSIAGLGLDSVDMAAAATKIGSEFGFRAGPTLLMSVSTLGDVAGVVLTKAPAVTKQVQHHATATAAPPQPAAVAVALTPAAVLPRLIALLTKFRKASNGDIVGTTQVSELGLDSVDLAAAAAKIGGEFGFRAGPTLLMNATTLSDLAAVVASKAAPARPSPAVPVPMVAAAPTVVPPAPVPTVDEIAAVLKKFAKDSSIVAVGPETSISSLGLDSMDMAAAAAELSKRFSSRVRVTLLMEAGSVGEVYQAVLAKRTVVAPAPAAASAAPDAVLPEPQQQAQDLPQGDAELVRRERAGFECADRCGLWHDIKVVGLTGLVAALGFALASFPAFALARPFDGDMWDWSCSKDIGYFYGISVFATVFWRYLLLMLVFVVDLFLYSVVAKWVLVGRVRQGEYKRWSWECIRMLALSNWLKNIGFFQKILLDTPILPLFYRALGAQIGKRVQILEVSNTTAFDLLHIGDDVTIDRGSQWHPVGTDDGITYVKRHIYVGAGTHIGVNAEVVGGAQLGREVFVCARSIAQGEVPSGCMVLESRVLPPDAPRPATAVRAALGTCDGPGLTLFVFQMLGLGLLSVQSLLALACGVCLLAYSMTFSPGVCVQEGADPSPIFTVLGLKMYITIQTAGIAVSALLLILVLLSAQAIVMKWVLIGKLRPGTRKVTPWFHARMWYVDTLMELVEQQVVMPYVRYTPLMAVWYKARGAKLPFSNTISPFKGYFFPDLLTAGKDVYWGVYPSILSQVCDPEAGEVTFESTHIGDRSFIGPDSMMMAGVQVEDGACVSAYSCVPPGVRVRSGTTLLGNNKVLAYRPTAMIAPLLPFLLLNQLFGVLNVLTQLLMLILSYGPGFALLCLPWVSSFPYQPHLATAGAVAMGTAQFLEVAVVPLLYFVLHIVVKWVVLGVVREGGRTPHRGWYHARWICCLTFGYNSLSSLRAYSHTRLPVLMHRLLGGKVGRCCRFDSFSVSPEADVMHYGDGVYLGEDLGVYSHDFSPFHLTFKPVVIHRHSRITRWLHLVPGTTLAAGTEVGHLSLVLPANYTDEVIIMQGNPAGECEKGPGGEWCHDSAGILSTFPAHPYDTSLLRRTGGGVRDVESRHLLNTDVLA